MNRNGMPHTCVYGYSLSFLREKRLRRILDLSGFKFCIGWPKEGDYVAVWGNSPTAHRGRYVSRRANCACLTMEDPFIRSLFPARTTREPPLGLLLDTKGVHFDPTRPSDLEDILRTAKLDDQSVLNKASELITRMISTQMTKYYATQPSKSYDKTGYILVIDQVRGDASVRASGADQSTFDLMLEEAKAAHPEHNIIIKTHPEGATGGRLGYFHMGHLTDPRITLLEQNIDPYTLLRGAKEIYTVSSQFGFEAILFGKRPHIFGGPFYAGWDLSIDTMTFPRRNRTLTKEQLFAGAMMLYPRWYSPFSDTLCDLEDILSIAEAEQRAWREDEKGWQALGIRLWKRKFIRQFFGQHKSLTFRPAKTPAEMRVPVMYWATKAPAHKSDIVRIEDGFLRSRGLGAELIPPMSLICDMKGIYYDPRQPSQLEDYIKDCEILREDQNARARKIITHLKEKKLTKYNLEGKKFQFPEGRVRRLVVGQVEDDASILNGTTDIRTNLDLLIRVRKDFPDDYIIYKPHPDVEAGLRIGEISAAKTLAYANHIATQASVAELIDQVEAVHTMTSNIGFEALIREKEVITYGAPFYAGWGLSTDLGSIPARRNKKISLEGLIYATLVLYPRYFDPKTGRPCPIETTLSRLETQKQTHGGLGIKLLSKAQGLLASFGPIWRS